MFSESIRIDLPIDLDRARKQRKATGVGRAKPPAPPPKPTAQKRSSQRAKDQSPPLSERKATPLANVLFPDGL